MLMVLTFPSQNIRSHIVNPVMGGGLIYLVWIFQNRVYKVQGMWHNAVLAWLRLSSLPSAVNSTIAVADRNFTDRGADQFYIM